MPRGRPKGSTTKKSKTEDKPDQETKVKEPDQESKRT